MYPPLDFFDIIWVFSRSRFPVLLCTDLLYLAYVKPQFMKSSFSLLILFFFGSPVLTSAANAQRQIDSIETRIAYYESCDSLTRAIYCLMDLANQFEYLGKWDDYDKTVEKMFSYSEKTNDIGYLAECYNKVGIASSLRGNNKKAVSYFEKGIKVSREGGDLDRVANFNENIGLVYKDMGDLHKALNHQMAALKLREKNPMHERLPNSYSNISQLWGFLGDTVKQWSYLMKAVAVDSTLELNHDRSAVLCCEVGEFLLDRKEYDQALRYFETGLEHCKVIGWQRGIAVFIGDMATLYEQQENWQESKRLHLMSLKFSMAIEDCQGATQEYISLASCYGELDMIDSAVIHIDSAMHKAINCELQNELRDALLVAVDIYQKKKQYEIALTYHKQYHALNDSLIGIAKQSNMRELETKYETEKKEQQIKLLSKENQVESQKSILLLVTIIALLLVIALGFLLYFKRKSQNKQKQEGLKQQLLRSQMNPHFLFNALGSIQNFMLKNDARTASSYLSNFASLTRSVLEFSAVEKITLSDEITYLQNYLSLEQLRLNHCFNFEIVYDDELETEFIKIPPMFIQPFVENAVKHGVKDLENDGLIELLIEEKNDQILFVLIDNGKGIQKKTASDHNSMAMAIFEERKRLIERKLKKSISYVVESPTFKGELPYGTKVTIGLPY